MNGTADGGVTMPASLGANRLPTRPTALSVQPDGIPAELMRRPQWVAWSYRWDERTQRWQKPPLSPQTDGPASPTDPTTWGTFDEALDRVEISGCDGIGFVLTADDPCVAVDLDDCIDLTTGKPTPFAESVLRELVSYTEISPSGTGLRILLKGTLEGGNRKRPDIEISADRQYVSLTGHHLLYTPQTINDRTGELAILVARLFPAAPPTAVHRLATPIPASKRTHGPGLTAADQVVLAQARARHGERFDHLYDKGDLSAYGDDHSRADLALCSMLAGQTADPHQIDRLFRRSALVRDKWLDRGDYGERTIAAALDRSGVAQSANQPQPTGGVGGVLRAAQPRPAPSQAGRHPGSSQPWRTPLWGDAGHHERRCRGCGTPFRTKRGMGGRHYCPDCRKDDTRAPMPGGGNTSHTDQASTNQIRQRVLQRDKQKCRACGMRAYQVAHVQPPSQGGAFLEENLMAVCTACRHVAPHLDFVSIDAKVAHVRQQRKLR